MFKVLNDEWEIIKVPVVDVTKHTHLSWRKFIKEDGFNKIVKVVKKELPKKDLPKKTLSSKKI